MPLKLRKISFEYHQEVLGTTSVALVPCPTGTCVLSNKRRYDRSAEVRPHFFDRFQIFIVERRTETSTMASAAKKLEAADEATERVEEPRTEPRTEERTHHSETEEEATKEDDSVDSSRFCIHCGENPCFVDTLFDAAESYCDRLGEERDRPLSMVWRAKVLRRYFYEHVGMDELPFYSRQDYEEQWHHDPALPRNLLIMPAACQGNYSDDNAFCPFLLQAWPASQIHFSDD
jgi:hypothetical protein